MATIEEKRDELEDVKAIRFISGALLEISAARMQQLRTNINENRNFYTEIGHLYALIKQSAALHGHLPSTHSQSNKSTTVSVAFTSNKRFYGAINHDIIDEFILDTSRMQTDCIVIGSTGRAIMENQKGVPSCIFHSFGADEPTSTEMQKFLKQVQGYQRILLYFPVFTSVFRQEVSVLDIAHMPPSVEEVEMSVEYIFEPELPNILAFFERRVRFLLFRHVMLETELARTAARFVAMSGAERQSEMTSAKLLRLITQLEDARSNRELLESLTGFAKFAQWKQQT
jgi:ATP synthase F1 gamma subunit